MSRSSRFVSAVSRGVRDLAFAIETLFARFFRLFSGLGRADSAANFVEAKIGRLTGLVGEGPSQPSRFGARIELAFGKLASFIGRWRLNYVFIGIFGGAILYQLYLISLGESGASRTALLTSLRFTIYAAIVFFSIAHFARSSLNPWSTIWQAWAGVVRRVRLAPVAFLACFGVYIVARLIRYIPASFFVGRESFVIVANFLMGMAFAVILAFVTKALYWRTIARDTKQGGSSIRLIVTAVFLWLASAILSSVLGAVLPLVRPSWTPVVFQFMWLAQMCWTALTLFLVPAIVTGTPKPIRVGFRYAAMALWTLIVSLILVNLPADLFSIGSGIASARLPQGLASRIAVDLVSAFVNAVVFFASQGAVLMLFVSAAKQFGRQEQEGSPV